MSDRSTETSSHLSADFAQLRLLRRPATNLPNPVTSFIGREPELAEIKRLLAMTRLLTLSGPGGSGKTRLAIEMAAELVAEFADGVWWVELAALTDPTLVPQVVAAALGVREQPGRSLTATLADYLRAKRLLLVLDNFEPVLGAALLVAELLAACPTLTVLTTSRVVLGVYGEHVFAVQPLRVPDPQHLPSAAELTQYEAVRLFVERAQAAKADFALLEDNAAAVAGICQRLDGLPLAIELAAGRMRLLTPYAMLARLSSRLELLMGGARDRPTRHQTLRSAIAWSYDLLSESEQMLFRRLAVFVGGFTLEAAQAVCNAMGDLGIDVLDGVGLLVDKSLVRQIGQAGGEPRFGMLETIREYALEQLAGCGELEILQQQFVSFFLALAEAAKPELTGPHQIAWIERLGIEHDNLRATLASSQAQAAHAQTGLRLAAALWRFWFLRGYWSEGRSWLEGALAQTQPARHTKARATVAVGAGMLAAMCTDYAGARALLEQGLVLGQEVHDQASMGFSMTLLGIIGFIQGDSAGHSRLEASVAILRETEDQWALAWALHLSGDVVSAAGDYPAARLRYEESLNVRRAIGDELGMVHTLGQLGLVFYRQGDYARAATVFEESVALGRELEYEVGLAYVLVHLGRALRHQGHDDRARALLGESLALGRELGDNRAMAWCLEAWADLACAEDQAAPPERAARLFGAAEALREAIGIPTDLFDRAEYERDVAAARGRLGEAAFAAAWAEGRALALEQAIAYALEATIPRQEIADRPAGGVASAEQQGVASLRLFALGPARVYRGQHALTSADWTYARARELFFYLLCHPPRSKGQIGLAFWPDASPTQLRRSLGVTLHHLRRALGRPGWIVFDHERYTFNRTLGYWFDVEAFEAHLAEARRLQTGAPEPATHSLEQAVQLYQGDFLADVEDREWVVLKREELRRQYLEALLSLGQLLFAEGRYDQAADVYRQSIRQDSYLEAAHRELMRCYARQGEVGQALRHYQVLVDMLRQELSAPPASETTALFERIRQGETV